MLAGMGGGAGGKGDAWGGCGGCGGMDGKGLAGDAWGASGGMDGKGACGGMDGKGGLGGMDPMAGGMGGKGGGNPCGGMDGKGGAWGMDAMAGSMGGKGGGNPWDAWGGMGKGDMWGPYGAMAAAMWGPWGGGGFGGGGFGAWGKGGGKPKPKKPQQNWDNYVPKSKGDMPDVHMLELPLDCGLVADGGCQNPLPVIEHEKLDIFSEANNILGYLCDFLGWPDIEYHHENVERTHPEIHRAWVASGHEESAVTLAKCALAGRCGVGMGGKANGARAAKLSLALALAQVCDPKAVKTVANSYPVFKTFLKHCGHEVAD